MVEVNKIYRHYKGNKYKVLAIGRHTESLEDLVIYEALYDNHEIWCRPISMWEEEIEINGKIVKRFEKIEE